MPLPRNRSVEPNGTSFLEITQDQSNAIRNQLEFNHGIVGGEEVDFAIVAGEPNINRRRSLTTDPNSGTAEAAHEERAV